MVPAASVGRVTSARARWYEDSCHRPNRRADHVDGGSFSQPEQCGQQWGSAALAAPLHFDATRAEKSRAIAISRALLQHVMQQAEAKRRPLRSARSKITDGCF
jgi:hypothetical protein